MSPPAEMAPTRGSASRFVCTVKGTDAEPVRGSPALLSRIHGELAAGVQEQLGDVEMAAEYAASVASAVSVAGDGESEGGGGLGNRELVVNHPNHGISPGGSWIRGGLEVHGPARSAAVGFLFARHNPTGVGRPVPRADGSPGAHARVGGDAVAPGAEPEAGVGGYGECDRIAPLAGATDVVSR